MPPQNGTDSRPSRKDTDDSTGRRAARLSAAGSPAAAAVLLGGAGCGGVAFETPPDSAPSPGATREAGSPSFPKPPVDSSRRLAGYYASWDVDNRAAFLYQIDAGRVTHINYAFSNIRPPWPQLAQTGGSTAVGGDPDGFCTQAEYADIVACARSRCITVIPEIEMPGHTNAAPASYPELDCDGVARPLHAGIETGFSTQCVEKDVTYALLDDVIREVSALTPGPCLHIGGDEVSTLSPGDSLSFVQRAQGIVNKYGKRMIGWDEVGVIDLLPASIAQYWNGPNAEAAARQGAKVIMSPSGRVYLEMKYNESTGLGLNWAGYVEVQHAYTWDPAALLAGVTEGQILGVEAPLWTETIRTRADIEYIVFPRLAGVAEIGWSAAGGREWNEYRDRLAEHGIRWTAWGLNLYRSPQVPRK